MPSPPSQLSSPIHSPTTLQQTTQCNTTHTPTHTLPPPQATPPSKPLSLAHTHTLCAPLALPLHHGFFARMREGWVGEWAARFFPSVVEDDFRLLDG